MALTLVLATACSEQPSPARDIALIGDQSADDATAHDAARPDLTDPGDLVHNDTDLAALTPPAHLVSGPCVALVEAGSAWDGWANLQYPARLVVGVDAPSEPIFGQVWRAGETEALGQATGWEAQLLIGPLGTDPGGVDGGCWRSVPAQFNVDVTNNDEYWTRVVVSEPGLYGLVFRYRPPGGAWKWGDANGSDDGLQPDRVAVLEVTPRTDDALQVMTLNLRCRADDWPARAPLVLAALVREAPDFIAFQEDCAVPGSVTQSSELRAALAAALGRGYAVAHITTHQAVHAGVTYDEGIALLGARDLGDVQVVDLPFAVFPRKALLATSRWRGRPLRVVGTHFDFGVANEGVRLDEAHTILAALGSDAAIVMGDLNAEPVAASVQALASALDDGWALAHPGEPGYTMPASAPTRRIDYVFVTPGQASSTDARLVDDMLAGTWLSDHLGVLVTLRSGQ